MPPRWLVASDGGSLGLSTSTSSPTLPVGNAGADNSPSASRAAANSARTRGAWLCPGDSIDLASFLAGGSPGTVKLTSFMAHECAPSAQGARVRLDQLAVWRS